MIWFKSRLQQVIEFYNHDYYNYSFIWVHHFLNFYRITNSFCNLNWFCIYNLKCVDFKIWSHNLFFIHILLYACIRKQYIQKDFLFLIETMSSLKCLLVQLKIINEFAQNYHDSLSQIQFCIHDVNAFNQTVQFVFYLKTIIIINLLHKCIFCILSLLDILKIHASVLSQLVILLNVLQKKRISSKHNTWRRKEHACDIKWDKLKHLFIENFEEKKDLHVQSSESFQ